MGLRSNPANITLLTLILVQSYLHKYVTRVFTEFH